jgi:DnaK suppressor protein
MVKKTPNKTPKKTVTKTVKKTPKAAAVKASKAPRAAKPKASRTPGKVAVEDENARRERLRKLLIQRRELIIREAKEEIRKFKSGEKRQLVETVMDDGDMSVMDMSEEISLKQLSTHRETLIKIDIAIRKLEEGTYGLCEECGDEISEDRLKVLPFAIYCRDDQEKREIFEKLERETH